MSSARRGEEEEGAREVFPKGGGAERGWTGLAGTDVEEGEGEAEEEEEEKTAKDSSACVEEETGKGGGREGGEG